MAQNRLTVKQMFALLDIDVEADFPFPAHIATDSRDVVAGSAFVAIEGEKTDGHNYIHQAVDNGAVLVIGRKGKRLPRMTVPYIELDEPEKELASLASRYISHVAPQEVIAVTGSVGKTTTREAIRAVLSRRFNLHSAERSLNTLIGCSTTVLSMPLDTDVLLLEFGANKMGEIDELTHFFAPSIAVITQIAPVHLAGFGSVEGVLKAKLEIIESFRLKSLIYNANNELLYDAVRRLPASIAKVGVGCSCGEYQIQDVNFRFDGTSPQLSFELVGAGLQRSIHAAVWGTQLAFPLAMAAVVADLLNIKPELSSSALSSFQGLKGRGRVMELSGGGRFLVDDAYNANPASMRSSLETFASLSLAGKKFAVLADMRELGEHEVDYHRTLRPLAEKLDFVVFVGPLWRQALPPSSRWRFVDGWKDASEVLKQNDDWQGLLIKGSNSFELENLVRWATSRYMK